MSNKPLTNLRILITRPIEQAAQLAKLIEQRGGQPVLLPTIVIKNRDPEQQAELQAVLANLAQQDVAIFVSPNAVRYVYQLMRRFDIPWPVDTAIAAVGKSTAAALQAVGLQATIVPAIQFSSEALLALPALQTVAGQHIILFRGEEGRELLSATLRERGAILTEVAVYRRELPAIDMQTLLPLWQKEGLDIIVCTSNSGLQNLVTLVGETARHWLLNMPLLVISQRMLAFARALGFVKTPLVADNATDAAIIKALVNYFDKTRASAD